MLYNQPDSYTLLLLSAFALYMLEYKNARYLAEAEDLVIKAFTNIQEKEPDWSDQKLEQAFNTFISLLIDKNNELKTSMAKHGFSFDFNAVTISRLLKIVQKTNQTLKSLNKILN